MPSFAQVAKTLTLRPRHAPMPSAMESLEPRRLCAATVDSTPTDDGDSLSIEGAAFLDADGNGYRSSPDLPKAGRTVFIDENNNGKIDDDEPVDTTNAAGAFSFSGLSAGTYTVMTELTKGEVQLAQAGLTDRANHFNIDLVFDPDDTFTDAQRNVFSAAARRWEQVIIGDLPEASDSGRSIDDLRIDVRTPDIDGSGGTLAQAAPTSLRQGSSLPYVGFIEADSSDLAHLTDDGQLYDVILHEMGHVLGIGTIWDAKGHLKGRGTSTVRFDGAAATAAYDDIFSTTGAVPVEDTGGAGTRDTHWRDSVLGDELMTGFIASSANPLSRITIGAMEDLGYRVNFSAADQYGPALSSVEQAGFGRAKVTLKGASVDDLELPISTPSVAALPAGTASVAGTVFDDANGDGIRDPSDAGIEGMTVFLDLNHNGRLERTEPTAQSAQDGSYHFSNLAAEAYTVRALGQSGYLRTGPQGLYHQVVLRGNDSSEENDFGFARPASIGGTVTAATGPVSGDGQPTTSGVEGATVFIDANGDGILSPGEKQDVSDANGTYRFLNLRPSTETVRLLTPTGYTAADPVKTLVLHSDESLTDQDFTLTILLA